MDRVTAIGLLAGSLTTFAYVPQVVKSWRSGSTTDVSLTMFAIMMSGAMLWLIYGAFLHDIPIMTANGVTLLLAGTILFLKIKDG
jgi:MtN3 and saliva related transmembrane protein